MLLLEFSNVFFFIFHRMVSGFFYIFAAALVSFSTVVADPIVYNFTLRCDVESVKDWCAQVYVWEIDRSITTQSLEPIQPTFQSYKRRSIRVLLGLHFWESYTVFNDHRARNRWTFLQHIWRFLSLWLYNLYYMYPKKRWDQKPTR